MTTSSIFKYANNISVSRDSNSARSITTGGYARTQRLGPTVISIATRRSSARINVY